MQNIDSLIVSNHQSSMQIQIYVAVEVNINLLRFLYWPEEDHYMEEWGVGCMWKRVYCMWRGGVLWGRVWECM